ncbi:helix-turn-helix domain-containing protein [Azospirillum agricola]
MRFETLARICAVAECQPADLDAGSGAGGGDAD